MTSFRDDDAAHGSPTSVSRRVAARSMRARRSSRRGVEGCELIGGFPDALFLRAQGADLADDGFPVEFGPVGVFPKARACWRCSSIVPLAVSMALIRCFISVVWASSVCARLVVDERVDLLQAFGPTEHVLASVVDPMPVVLFMAGSVLDLPLPGDR